MDTLVHPKLQSIRGLVADEEAPALIDRALADAVEIAKDLEAERDELAARR